MKILVGIPCVNGLQHTRDAINSVLNQVNVDLLIIDNGATQELKGLFNIYAPNPSFKVIVNDKNIYVNPAWNQIVKYFLEESQATHLVIMNSDLVLQHDWAQVLMHRFARVDKETLVPTLVQDVKKVGQKVNITNLKSTKVTSAPGIFITLSRFQAHLIYPITEECRIWYGDNWVYDILKGVGYSIIIPENLIAHHGVSQTIQCVPEAGGIITEDNKIWAETVSHKVLQKIKELLNG